MPLPKPNAVVFAKDVARLAGFYQALAGMLVVHAAKDHVVLDGGAYQLVLHGIPKKIADAIHITEPPELREDTALKMCFPVASIAHAREAAVALGGQVYPSKKEWVARGFRACDGFDPEGNVFQVRESEETP